MVVAAKHFNTKTKQKSKVQKNISGESRDFLLYQPCNENKGADLPLFVFS